MIRPAWRVLRVLYGMYGALRTVHIVQTMQSVQYAACHLHTVPLLMREVVTQSRNPREPMRHHELQYTSDGI